MNIDILINQLDEHNEVNILATKRFNPKEVIFLYDKELENLSSSISDYYKQYMPNIKLNKVLIEEGKIDKLKSIINQNKNRNILVNLTGGSRINSLILLDICKNNSIRSLYVDIKNKYLYIFDKEIEVIKEEFEDMKINNVIRASGGEILTDSTNLINKEDLVYLTKSIYRNLDLWHKYKQRLYDSRIFIHNYEDPRSVRIKTEFLSMEERNLLDKILDELEESRGISFKEISDEEIQINFKNEYLKSFIFKSGTWLEVATNIMINEINEIDEVKSGVMFLWNDKSKIVRNEIDVVAVKDSVPICISCKDSDRYNEDALNELDVYSTQIGGEETYKILVATKEPIKPAVKERAKEMGINLVIFDGNEEKFKSKINDIISKKI